MLFFRLRWVTHSNSSADAPNASLLEKNNNNDDKKKKQSYTIRDLRCLLVNRGSAVVFNVTLKNEKQASRWLQRQCRSRLSNLYAATGNCYKCRAGPISKCVRNHPSTLVRKSETGVMEKIKCTEPHPTTRRMVQAVHDFILEPEDMFINTYSIRNMIYTPTVRSCDILLQLLLPPHSRLLTANKIRKCTIRLIWH